jgi:AraC-like DNA-binding protein
METGIRISAFWLRSALEGLTGAGFDAREYWKRRKLDYPNDDLQVTYPYEEVVRMWRTAVQETGNPHIGLHAGEALPVRTSSMFSYILLSAPNLREGLALMTRFQELVMSVRITAFENRGDQFWWTAQLPLAPVPPPQQLEYIFAVVMRVCFFVGGEGFRPMAMNLRHAAQGDPKEYERILRCPVAFLTNENSVLFDRESLLKPNPFANPTTLKMLVDAAENLLAQRSPGNWAARVNAALQPILASGNCTLEGIARSMHVSTRTLQRSLAAENATFQGVLDQVRRERAMELMAQSEMPLARVAKETGFADARAFNRAFQRWTGQPPSTYREAKAAPRRHAAPRLRVVGN